MSQVSAVGLAAAVLLLALSAVSALPYKPQSFSSSSTTTTITTSTNTVLSPNNAIRLRGPNKLRRPESCRESLPRKSEDLPALVVSGRVREVYLAGGEQSGSPGASPTMSSSLQLANGGDPANNKALFTIGRVIKGNQQLVGTDIIFSGFNATNSMPCPNYVKPNDTLILFLTHDGDRKYSIQGNNLLSMNLNNLDRVNAVAADEPFKRRGLIEDILCEAHYCAYGRCVVNERAGQQASVSCQCPDNCPSLPTPVCGSDNTTYTNECHLIKEGCKRQRPLFVTKEASC